MTVDILAPRDVHTTLDYYVQTDDTATPYIYVQDPPKSNIQSRAHPAVVHDARGKSDAFGLDVSGFQWVTYPSAEKAFVDEERIKGVYYAEVEDVLKTHAGAKRVFIFDHTIRRSGGGQTEQGKAPVRGPAVSTVVCAPAGRT